MKNKNFIIPSGKDYAISITLHPRPHDFTNEVTVSDGNIVLGCSKDHVAIAFNNTEYNQNSLVVLTLKDAEILKILLTSITA